MATTSPTAPPTTPPVRLEPHDLRRLIGRRAFCTLATASADGRPHAAGVLYVVVGEDLWVNTLRVSRKARDVAANPRVSVCIPVRRLPVGPPSTIQLSATAEVLAPGDPRVVDLLREGALRPITSHGELDEPDACFLRITPAAAPAPTGSGCPSSG